VIVNVNKTEPKPNRTRGFFQNRNQTEVQKSIPHVPTIEYILFNMFNYILSANEMHVFIDLIMQEVMLVPQPADSQPNCTYFMTLMGGVEGQLQLRVSDCVYIAAANSSDNQDKLNIYRIERLWINARFIFNK